MHGTVGIWRGPTRCLFTLQTLLRGTLLAAYPRALAAASKPNQSDRRGHALTFWRVFLAIVICVGCASGSAQDWDRTITQFQHTAWGPKEGAPSQIRALAQTTDGFLWLGTSGGLYHFDGVSFERYEPRSGPSLPSDRVRSLFALPNGDLWVGYYSGEIVLLRQGHAMNYTSAEGVPAARIMGFAQDREGTIWAATLGGLARLEGSRWKQVGKDWNFPGVSPQAAFVDRQGTLWVATEKTIVFLPAGAKAFQSTGIHVGQLLQILQAANGQLWMAETTRSVRPIPLGGKKISSQEPDIWVGSVGFLFDREGALWITTIGDGLRRAAHPERLHGKLMRFSNQLESFTAKDGLTDDFSYPIIEDNEGNIWVGTYNGLDRFRKTNLVPVALPRPPRQPLIVADKDGAVWLHSMNLSIRVRGTHIDEMDPVAHSFTDYVLDVFRTTAGTIWWVGNTNLHRVVDGRFTSFPIPEELLRIPPRERLLATEDGLGGVWVTGKGAGLYHMKDGVWRRIGISPEIVTLTGAAAFTDSSGRAWFGYDEGPIITVENGNVRIVASSDNAPVGSVYTIHGRGQHVWAGGESGLAFFDGSRFRSVAPVDAPKFGPISGIVETSDGDLWLAGFRGVVHIPSSEVAKFLENGSYRVRYELFDSLDGLPGEIRDRYQAAVETQGTDGRLWFAASNGLAWLNPAHISRNNVPPTVSVRSLIADGKNYPYWTNATLPPLTRKLQIQFTALSLSVPERVRFRYKLEGVDKDWQDAGTRREAFYTNLGPGNYRFHVIACNNDGVWNETGATLDFALSPAWYQTIWFRSACVLALALLLWALHHLRLGYLERQFQRTLEARVAERMRIARELHDTLLQSFQAVLMKFHVGVTMIRNRPDEAERILEGAVKQATQAVTEGRDAVQGLRSSAEVTNDLARAIRVLGAELADQMGANAPDFRVSVEGTPRDLAPILRDDLYRIAGEAMRNAFQHAQAARIEVEIRYDQRQLRLLIRDDGKGIDPDVLESGARAGHYGLPGLHERAKLVGGKLTVQSEPGSGTEVELTVPASVAYDPPSGRHAPVQAKSAS